MASIPTNFALLDLKFSPVHTHILCAATSTGSLSLWTPTYSISNLDSLPDGSNSTSPAAKQICCLQFFRSDVIVLSCTWHPHCPEIIGVTLSSGEIYIVKLPREVLDASSNVIVDPALLQKTLIFSGTLEPWTLTFNPLQDEIFSGFDDCALRIHSLPPDPQIFSDDAVDSKMPEFKVLSLRENRRIHGAGVTAILYLSDNIVMTGSYDNFARVLLIPSKGRPEVLAEADLDGGVWRLQIEQSHCGFNGKNLSSTFCADILASCMHAGVRVLRVKRNLDGDWNICIIAKFEEHKSMNYGSDSYLDNKTDARRVISTSFYDALVCLWEYTHWEVTSE